MAQDRIGFNYGDQFVYFGGELVRPEEVVRIMNNADAEFGGKGGYVYNPATSAIEQGGRKIEDVHTYDAF